MKPMARGSDLTAFSLKFPRLPGERIEPLWDGESFVVGDDRTDILRYPVGQSGWTDHLTELHKELSDGRHYIDVASRKLAMRALKRYCSGTGRTILEVGVSEGHLLREMQAEGRGWCLIGADYTYETLKKLDDLRQKIPLVQFDLSDCPLPDGFADGLVALNVLEHIERDDRAVAHCFRILRPGGIAVIEVPSGPSLYDQYDRELMHFRRYDIRNLIKVFQTVGFKVLERTHIGFSLYPAFHAYKKASRFRQVSPSTHPAEKSKDHVTQAIGMSSSLGRLGSFLMAGEDVLRQYIYLPFGIRCCVVCQKPLS